MNRTPQTILFRTLSAAIVVLSFSSSVHALRSTTQESYTDPDYLGYRPRNVVLMVVTEDTALRLEVEERLTTELAVRGLTVFRQVDLFPPTRQWSEADQLAVYDREQIDSGIIVAAGASSSSVIPYATQTYSSGRVFGNYDSSSGSFNATGSGTSTSSTLFTAKSKAEFSAVLLDIRSNRVAWYGDVFTKAGGTLFVGTRRDAKGAVKGIVEGLSENGHIGDRS